MATVPAVPARKPPTTALSGVSARFLPIPAPFVGDCRRAAAVQGHVIGKDGAMTARDTALDLIQFIDASPSPYHAAAEAQRRLIAAGFTELGLADTLPSGP